MKRIILVLGLVLVWAAMGCGTDAVKDGATTHLERDAAAARAVASDTTPGVETARDAGGESAHDANVDVGVDADAETSSDTIPASYFGQTVQSYNYSGEPWPATFGARLTLVRNIGVWYPGSGACCNGGPHWNSIQPQNGTCDPTGASGTCVWTTMDAWMAVNEAKGVDVMFALHSAPSWTGGGGTNPTPAQVTNFFTALATRYKGKIKYYEGYNEFNASPAIFSGTTADMVNIQKALYQAVKAADPSSLVISYTITGLFYGSSAPWDAVTKAGGSAWFDIAGFHGYTDGHGESLVTEVEKFKAALVADGLANVPIFDTEGAWQPDGLTDETLQTAYVMKSWVLEYWFGVKRKVWYALDGLNVGRLVNPQFTSTLNKAGTAYVSVSRWLEGAAMAGAFNRTDGTIWYGDLTRGGGYKARVIWTPADGATPYAVPPEFTQYRDYTDKKIPVVGGKVNLGIIPILLENHDP
jgi:hypothetical protein